MKQRVSLIARRRELGRPGRVTLALNFGSPAEVDAVIEEARAPPARLGREPAETFWGGYTGLLSPLGERRCGGCRSG